MFIFAFVLILLFPFSSSFAVDDNLRVSSETPASFFSTGIECFYFSKDGLRKLKYENANNNRKQKATDNTSEFDFEITFTKDGNAVMERLNKNYACPEDIESNCLASDVIVEKIDVVNLVGKQNAPVIKEQIKTKSADHIHFTIGSKIYSLKTEIPAYDFASFNDFDKLRCLQDENGDCLIFKTDGKVDTPTLLGFSEEEVNGEILLVKKINDNASYIYDDKNTTIFQANSTCIEKTTESTCSKNPAASVKQITRPDGLNYFKIEYLNPMTKAEIYFTDHIGRGFKAYLNPKRELIIYMFNKTAAEMVGKTI